MKYKSIMAAVMAAILICMNVFAAPSQKWASEDYRSMQLINRNDETVKKPKAHFSAKRISGGEIVDAVNSYVGYDCETDIPTLTCYVGDTLRFEDLSRDTNPDGHIVGWDWQYFGSLGNSSNVYSSNPVNSTVINLTEEGETTFFLCVKNNAAVKNGCCDPWSENGNHQTVGKNKYFPKGAYWYFTAIRVVVKPIREAIVYVRYWDAQNNRIFHEGYVSAGMLYNDADTVDTSVHITDWEGYKFLGWNMQLPNGEVQYSGKERDVGVTLAGWLNEKYLNVDFYPYMDTSLTVRYWDSAENRIISEETLAGQPVAGEEEIQITANLTSPTGYNITGWNVQLPDGKVQYTGEERTVPVALNGYVTNKNLNVECKIKTDASSSSIARLKVNYIDEETQDVIYSEEIPGINVNTEFVTELKDMSGYIITGWVLKQPDGTVEKTGVEDSVSVIITKQELYKILDVNCLKITGSDNGTGEEDIPEPTITVKPSGECDGVIEWTENASHRVPDGYRNNKQQYRTCRHTFEYKAVLNGSASINPDTLKSGYGFETTVNCTLTTNLVSNSGGCRSWGNDREPIMNVDDPTTATVYIPWDMSNRLGIQSKAITMEQDGRLKFKLPVSNVSESGARKIYTPVELPGTEEESVTHSFEIYISGGGIDGIEFCKKFDESITINGDMYSDDFSGAD